MWRYLSGALVLLLLGAGGMVLHQRATIATQEAAMTTLTRERDNLRSELDTAQERLRLSQRAQATTAEALSRAQAASRELASIKDWIRGNEDAPIPAWFDDLLVRLGLSVRPAAD